MLNNLDLLKKQFSEKLSKATTTEQKKKLGMEFNLFRQKQTRLLKANIKKELEEKSSSAKNSDATIDLTTPGLKPNFGYLHPTTQTINRLNNFFRYHGFSVMDGPEIETDENNFEKLNLPKNHPARDLQDTLYITDPDILLRTHTSSVEVATMLKYKPPIRIVVPGKCYRNETANSTNGALFYQYEGLYIDKTVTMANLKWILIEFAKYIYGNNIKTRFRCKYYPQVEPGVGLDIKCPFCKGEGCTVCKHRGYIELLGAGMVHPNALLACGIDNKVYAGFAFGMGLDRIVMTSFGINDIRVLYNGDLVYT